jgi:PAS domain S-box-containing protein
VVQESEPSAHRRARQLASGVISWVIMQANHRLCQMTGYTREELVGQNVCMVYVNEEECFRDSYEAYQQAALFGSVRPVGAWGGTVVRILVSSSPLKRPVC